MPVTLVTVDKIAGLPEIKGPVLSFSLERVTPREIVTERVTAECARAAQGRRIFGGWSPAEREVQLNGPRRLKGGKPDLERQIEIALAAIRSGEVIMFFDGAQVTDLDRPLPIAESSAATFVRLVPLAGG